MKTQSAFSRVLAITFMTLCLCAAGTVAHAESPSVWVTLGDDAFDTLVKSRGVLSQPFPPKAAGAKDGVVITRLERRDLPAVSELMHVEHRRCGGFIVHESYAEAVAAMEAATRIPTKIAPGDFTIDQQAKVNQLQPLIDKDNILSHITHLSTQYTNRYYTYTSGQQSALWIRDLWQGYAAGRSDVTVTTYNHSGYVQPSVILTIDGSSLPSEVVVLGGHLDSIRSGGMSPSTVAPGADDNASGIGALSEAIRVLMEDGWVPDRTVKFMGYAAEEVGLQGSGDIAADHQSAGTDVVAVMQLDMTDYNGSAEDIVLMDDYTNADLSTFVSTLVDTYQPSLTWTYSSCGYGCSDHASWHNRGFPAVFPFEARFGQHNSQIHTSNDTLATLGNQADHALKFSKLALAFAIETGMDGASCSVDADCDDGLYCNGAETCNAGSCQAGGDPCPGQGCDEAGDVCTAGGPCTHAADFEGGGADGWTNGNDTCSTGSFVAGTPNSTAWQVASGNPGGAYYTQPNTAIGTDDVDGGTCEALSPVIDCAGHGAADVSLDYFHGQRDAGDDSNDGFTIEVLNDGAVVETIVAIGDVTTNPAWTSVQTTISNPGDVQIRVRATDAAGPGDIVEGGIDNVQVSASGPQCAVDADCDDGAWCNGAETCNAGSCQSGTAPVCDDGAFCNGVETCNESTDSCDAGTPPACDDGLWCNGTETCNESTDSCDAGTPPACDDGLFCNGVETCNEATDSCDAGSDPCTPFGCDEGGDVCLECNVDADCDDGAFCNGAETCNAGSCQAGSDPCSAGETCNEATDVCEGGGGCPTCIDWTVTPTVSYSNQDADGNVTVESADSILLQDNTWRRTTQTFNVTADTVIEFDFQSTFQGEIHGIGFDEDDSLSSNRIFKVHGTQNWGITDFDNYSGSGLVHYTIPVGQHFTGSAMYLVLVNDNDAGSGNDSRFQNVEVYDVAPGACTLDDDFESGTAGWVNDASSTCTTGAYVTGDPTNPSGGYQVAGSHSGTNSIFTGVNTSAGSADVDGGNCVLASPSWPVAPASTLSVWYFHGQRDAGDDAAGDFFTLEVSTNGGSSWSTIASNGDTTSNPAWTEATAQIPAGSDVQLRVQCSDGSATGDLIECGIDDVSICDN